MTGRWYRDVYCDAIWEDETLKSSEKAVAETYARHARDTEGNKSATADLAWLTYERLMSKAGIGRRAGVSTSVARLVDLGWLTAVQQVSRRATVYRLTIPSRSSTVGTTERAAVSSDGGTTEVPLPDDGSSTSPSGSSDGGTQPLRPSKELTTISLSPREDEQPSATTVPAQRTEREIEPTSSSKPKSEEPNPVHRQLLDAGCPTETLTEVEGELLARHQPRSPAWWRTVAKNGDLPDLVAEVLEALEPVQPQLTAEHIANAHEYEPRTDGVPTCKQCDLPRPNGRHRVGNQAGGYVTQLGASDQKPRTEEREAAFRPSTAAARARQGLAVADELDRKNGHGKYASGLDEYGNGRKPGSTYHHLTDSRAPNRDYHEKF